MSTPGGYYSPFMAEPPRPTHDENKKILTKTCLGVEELLMWQGLLNWDTTFRYDVAPR